MESSTAGGAKSYVWVCNDQYEGSEEHEMSVGLDRLQRDYGLRPDDLEEFSAGKYSIQSHYPKDVSGLFNRFKTGVRVAFFCDNRIGRDDTAGERFIIEMYDEFSRRGRQQGTDAVGLYLVTGGSPSEDWVRWRKNLPTEGPVVQLLQGEERWRREMAAAFGALLEGRAYRTRKAVVDALTRAIHDLHSLPVRMDIETVESLLVPNLAPEDLALCAEIWEASFGGKAGDKRGAPRVRAALWRALDDFLSEPGEDNLTARGLAEGTGLDDLEGRIRELLAEVEEWSKGLPAKPSRPAAWTDHENRLALRDHLRAGEGLATEIVELLRTVRERERS